MNINMSIDCSPEEARRLMGLPDLSPIHDLYLDQLKQTMTEGVSPELFEKLVRSWSPFGEAGLSAWKQMMNQMTATGTKG